MTISSLILSLGLSATTYTAPIKVAVIDTGSNNLSKLTLCDTGHIDFTRKKLVVKDNVSSVVYPTYTKEELLNLGQYDFRDRDGHGTNVSHLIEKNANSKKYCQIVIKYWDRGNTDAVKNTILAFKHAKSLNVDIINYSSGGVKYYEKEKRAVSDLLKKNIILVAAAGNSSQEMTRKQCIFYPACYFMKTVVVGNGFSNKKRASTSNYGEIVDIWEDGQLKTASGVTNSGTSQSAAIITGKIINYLSKQGQK